MMRRIAMLIALGGITMWPGVPGAATLPECRKACRDATQACADACNDVDLHGLSMRKCKSLCKSPRVRSSCVRLCKQTGIGS